MTKIIAALCAGVLSCVVCVTASAEDSGITVDVLLQSSESWNGAPLPAYPSGKPEITIVRVTIAPGQALDLHKHPVINAGVVLTGELNVRSDNGQEAHLTAGDALVELVDTWHFGRNEGTVPTQLIIVYAGIEGEAVTVYEPKE